MKIKISFHLGDDPLKGYGVARIARCPYSEEKFEQLMKETVGSISEKGAEVSSFMPRGGFSYAWVEKENGEGERVDIKDCARRCVGMLFEDARTDERMFYVRETDFAERIWYFKEVEIEGDFDPSKLVIPYKRNLEPMIKRPKTPIERAKYDCEVASWFSRLRAGERMWDGIHPEIHENAELGGAGYVIMDEIAYDGQKLMLDEEVVVGFEDFGYRHWCAEGGEVKFFKELCDL